MRFRESRTLSLASAFGLAAVLAVPGPADGQERPAVDVYWGTAGAAGALAKLTERPTPFHVGLGVNVPVSDAWSLGVMTSLHEFEEHDFLDHRGAGVTRHLHLWHFLAVAERRFVGGPHGLQVRARGGLGATATGSDQALSFAVSDRTAATPVQGFSHLLPALHAGVDLGYRLGAAEPFLRLGGTASLLTNDDSFVFRDLSDREVEPFNAMVSLPVLLGVRLRF